jgi:hypothetical protein
MTLKKLFDLGVLGFVMVVPSCQVRDELKNQGAQSSELADVEFSGLPEGVDEEKSTVSIKNTSTTELKSYRLSEAKSLQLQPGSYVFNMRLFNSSELIAESGLAENCKPEPFEVKADTKNSVYVRVCKVTKDSKNPSGDLDLKVEIVDAESPASLNFTVDQLVDTLYTAYVDFKEGRTESYLKAEKRLAAKKITIVDFKPEALLIDPLKTRAVRTKQVPLKFETDPKTLSFFIICNPIAPGSEGLRIPGSSNKVSGQVSKTPFIFGQFSFDFNISNCVRL